MVETGQMGVYNVTGPNYTLTMDDLLQACQKICGSTTTFTWVSERFLWHQQVNPWSDLPLWIPETGPWVQEKGSERGLLSVDFSKAYSTGLTFRPLSETIRDTLAWYQTLPADKKWRAGLSRERESELLQTWHRQK